MKKVKVSEPMMMVHCFAIVPAKRFDALKETIPMKIIFTSPEIDLNGNVVARRENCNIVIPRVENLDITKAKDYIDSIFESALKMYGISENE